MTRKLALAGLFVLGPVAFGQTPTSLRSGWEVVVRPYEARAINERGRLYWVGLRNTATAPQAFCALGVWYRYDLLNGGGVDQPSREYPSVGSAHACAPTMGHLVLPGETHFVSVRVTLPDDAEIHRQVLFSVTAEETCVDITPCEHRAIYAIQASTRY